MFIKLKFRLSNTINNFLFNIRIFDNNCNLILTDVNNTIDFKVPHYGIYKIYVLNKCITIHINRKSNNEYLFILNTIKKHIISVELKDQYYEGLPIMKGNVILWQNNI